MRWLNEWRDSSRALCRLYCTDPVGNLLDRKGGHKTDLNSTSMRELAISRLRFIILVLVYLPLVLAFFVAFALVEDAAFSQLATILGVVFFLWISLMSRFSLLSQLLRCATPRRDWLGLGL